MAEKQTYDVHRAMHGDGKDYARGDTRQMTEVDAADLVARGALSLKGEPPVERQPGVVHTYGAEPSALNDDGFILAIGDGVVSLPREPSVAVNRTTRRPAKAV